MWLSRYRVAPAPVTDARRVARRVAGWILGVVVALILVQRTGLIGAWGYGDGAAYGAGAAGGE